ncbi:LamG-like jellyroll fold domain-containing protein [Planctomicrobium sp. SH664]|uniref:LamG domain-containing protein n=1 Tax=Planctomicrobium sp. SH664 TaxID=3448125 RepID=UPI003F5B3B42
MLPRLLTLTACFLFLLTNSPLRAEFRAGAVAVDVTPEQFPVIVNGGILSRTVSEVTSRLHARALALADGKEEIAIVVVDSCMLPKDLIDDVKRLASISTGLPTDRILISATHTHSAGSAVSCLGTEADPNYVPYLRAKLVEAIESARKNLTPAKVGFGSVPAEDFTAIRRWIRRPDRVAKDPFGNPTVRANMHAARNPDDVVGESGPEDPELALISIQSLDGKPLAVLANFSMHYFSGEQGISADYYGLFSEGLKARLSTDGSSAAVPFVGMMSHGCSGDIWRQDYAQPDLPVNKFNINQFTEGLLDLALQAYKNIEYQADADLAMEEARLKLNYRVPDEQRLQWAKGVVAAMGDRQPKDLVEVYAREQILLHEKQSTEVVVQAIRIGNIAIATSPCETYALTGLKIKRQSPLPQTIVIELANGGDGYIPPPEQHLLGGYNTWPARSAGLEVQAEPKIAAAALRLLETVTGKTCRPLDSGKANPPALASLKPHAWYRLDEMSGPRARDASGAHRDGIYEPRIAYFLTGPELGDATHENRAVHFSGDRLRSQLPAEQGNYSIAFWFWNGMPVNGRDVTGWMYSRGREHTLAPYGEHLGLGGKSAFAGKLVFVEGTGKELVGGRTEIPRWSWNHVVLVREGNQVRVYLNGQSEPEITATTSTKIPEDLTEIFFGGRCDHDSNWEGRLDEIAIFDRVLSPAEISRLQPSPTQQK